MVTKNTHIIVHKKDESSSSDNLVVAWHDQKQRKFCNGEFFLIIKVSLVYIDAQKYYICNDASLSDSFGKDVPRASR